MLVPIADYTFELRTCCGSWKTWKWSSGTSIVVEGNGTDLLCVFKSAEQPPKMVVILSIKLSTSERELRAKAQLVQMLDLVTVTVLFSNE
jgi:hypothetical protein